MKCKVMQQDAPLYPQPRAEGAALRSLQQGDIVELTRVKRAGGEQWLDVALPDGTRGFLPGKTPLFAMKRVMTNQPEVQLYNTPGRDSLKATLKKGTVLDLQGLAELDGEKWIQVQDQDGNSGYVDGKTRIVQVRKPSMAGGVLNIDFGTVISLAGICFLASMIGASPFDWMQFLIRLTWLTAGLGWLVYGITQVIQARKK
jgi:hypothetical protein